MTVPYNELLTVGHVRRAHGLKSEVVVHLSTNRSERLESGARLWTEDRELVVKSSRPKDQGFLVFFQGVSGREQADELRGSELRGEPIDDPDELWVHDLIGAMVIDQAGVERGAVTEVHENPASDLLVLDSGALVPVVFVVMVEGDTIRVDVPDGLFDL